jgi:hypothetical protein
MLKRASPANAKRRTMGGVFAALLCSTAILPTLAAQKSPNNEPVPDFATTVNTSWVLDRTLDDLLAPPSGPGPIAFDKEHPYVPNGRGAQPTYRVSDLTNPILKPWVAEQMKRTNDEVLAGKVPFRARERCWPIGTPGFVIYSLVEPFYFYQTPKQVTVINQGGPEVRRIQMNVPHTKNPKPSWYGESVGHYEGGDTLVIDTIGITEKTFVDNYRTPHTNQLHVVERWKIMPDGEHVEVSMTVEDPGAFNMPWSATQHLRRVERAPLTEVQCNENNANYLEQYSAPMPTAEKPDF